jgi:PAS domain S-box-containing protein
VEIPILRKDGGTRIVLWNSANIYAEDGKTLMATIAQGQDITKRKKAEEALKESEEKYRGIIEATEEGIWLSKPDGKTIFVNQKMVDMLGYSREEIIYRVGAEFMMKGQEETVTQTREELKKGRRIQQEIQFCRKDGSVLWTIANASPMFDDRGQHVSNLFMHTDITERKKAEEALRDSQKDLNRAQVVAKIGSWRLDVRRNELLWSDETHRMFGIPRGTSMTYETFLGAVHPDDREFVDQKWKASLRGEPYDIEHRIVVNGEVKWVRQRAELEFDKDGALLSGFGTVQEISERKQMQDKLEDYARHLEELVEERTKQLRDAERLAAIGQTAGMVGHDIRNPLQSIIGDVYLAKMDLASLPDSEEKESVRESLEAIGKQTEYINKIVLDLQDFAKPLNPHAEETDLERLIEELLVRNDVPENIQTDAKVDVDAKKVMADSAYMKRIMGNLISNAVQAMPDGGKLAIRAYREAGDVVITVEDTGVGIPDEAKPKLFQPLFTTKSKGQGFGLAVVKRLTEALIGTITFDSQEGKGTKFIIKLPIGR